MRFAAAVLVFAFAEANAAADDIDVRVQIDGEEVVVDASLFVRAAPQEAWVVLTDYDSASKFMSNLDSSDLQAPSASVCASE